MSAPEPPGLPPPPPLFRGRWTQVVHIGDSGDPRSRLLFCQMTRHDDSGSDLFMFVVTGFFLVAMPPGPGPRSS